jgi:hypothetical protein
VSADELAAVVAAQGALPVPVPVGPEPQASGGFPPALPWAALMDDDDLAEFLNELAEAAIRCLDPREALAEVERACGTWRLVGEAQHGHNTAPCPDAMTRTFSSVASLREPEHEAAVHHAYRIGRDLPETGGTQ